MPGEGPYECEPILPCPTCGAMVGFTLDQNGEPNGIVHAMPMCKDFADRTANEYLVWFNEHYKDSFVEPDDPSKLN